MFLGHYNSQEIKRRVTNKDKYQHRKHAPEVHNKLTERVILSRLLLDDAPPKHDSGSYEKSGTEHQSLLGIISFMQSGFHGFDLLDSYDQKHHANKVGQAAYCKDIFGTVLHRD